MTELLNAPQTDLNSQLRLKHELTLLALDKDIERAKTKMNLGLKIDFKTSILLHAKNLSTLIHTYPQFLRLFPQFLWITLQTFLGDLV